MPKIDGDRLMADLRRLAQFGAYKTGVHRPTYSDVDVASRHWLVERFTEAGLDAAIDGIGNVYGRPRRPGKRLLVGSHTETQNHAGWLDGALGVLYGLEIARAFADDPACRALPVEVASWADEEGHFLGFPGSRSFIGALGEEEIDGARDRTDGTPMRTALDRAGYAGRPRHEAAAEAYVGYLEAHIEQGDVLESTGRRLGVVTSIVGIWQYRIRFEGTQNHAGTTRMAIRRDAGLALVKLAGAIDRLFPTIAGPRSVWTTGAIRLDPGQPSVIPGHAEMLFQFRDDEPGQLARFEQALTSLVAEANNPCAVTLEPAWKVHPVVMAEPFRAALKRSAERHCPGGVVAMPSAAGHDAQVLARIMPSAMLFVPSIGGISHHWSEDTKEADIVLGCQVLADAAERILRDAAGRG